MICFPSLVLFTTLTLEHPVGLQQSSFRTEFIHLKCLLTPPLPPYMSCWENSLYEIGLSDNGVTQVTKLHLHVELFWKSRAIPVYSISAKTGCTE